MAEEVKVCPSCGEEVESLATVFLCDKCGTRYDTMDEADSCCAHQEIELEPEEEEEEEA